MNRRTIFWVVLSMGLVACQETTLSSHSGSLSSACQGPVDVIPYLRPDHSCTRGAIEQKRQLYPWIPCNRVERVDTEEDLLETNGQIYQWLAQEKRFDAAATQQTLERPALLPSSSADNPILRGAIVRTITGMIRSAKETVFLDIFLVGGTLGVEIARELTLAADRGVEVIILHDTETVFAVRSESEPLWRDLRAHAQLHEKMVALRADIHQRPSAIPFGMQAVLTALLDPDKKGDVAMEGRSDHSKLLVVDGFTDQARLLVSSHNLVDSAAAYFHDEAVLVEGPAAVVSQLLFQRDLELARALGEQENALSGNDLVQIDAWLRRGRVRWQSDSLPVSPRGDTKVQALEANGDDSVRNLEHAILALIGNAGHSVALYGRLAYNVTLAEALSNAMKRGVEVRVILDRSSPTALKMNSILPRLLVDLGAIRREKDAPVRWHTPLPTILFPAEKERPPLVQEIHAKSLIVDGEWSVFGSSNFDGPSWSGGSREFSAAVADPQTARQALSLFDRLWSSDELTAPHAAVLGQLPFGTNPLRSLGIMVLQKEADRTLSIRPSNLQPGCF